MNQEVANNLTYKDRYSNYKKYYSDREKKRLSLKPWEYSQKIQPWSYAQWLKLSSTSSLPAECRAGQGKEPWQS